MKNVIRSQLYQLVLDKAIFLIILMWLILDLASIGSILYEVSLAGEACSGGKMMSTDWFQLSEVFVAVITSMIMTKDYFDKTINYEFMTGKSRTAVFMGRFIPALVICEVGMLMSLWCFPLVYTAVYGWGEELAVSGAVQRTLVSMLIVFRICAEFALFSVIFRRKAMTYFMMIVVYLVPTLISDFFIGSYYLESEKFAPFVPLLNIFTVNSIHEICFFDK
nr:ABC transporter permease subunit [Ruminococcus sp.]